MRWNVVGQQFREWDRQNDVCKSTQRFTRGKMGSGWVQFLLIEAVYVSAWMLACSAYASRLRYQRIFSDEEVDMCLVLRVGRNE